MEDGQNATTCPASPKKRKADSIAAIDIQEDLLAQTMERSVAKALQAFLASGLATGSLGDVQSLRSEMRESTDRVQAQVTRFVNEAMAKMQAEADRRLDAIVQKLTQTLNSTPRQLRDQTSRSFTTGVQLDATTQNLGRQSGRQPARVAQPFWAKVTATGAQATAAAAWTTVANSRRRPKKHPLEQRRFLFSRNVHSYTCDPREIMLEVNRALALARAHVTVRLIKMRYIDKGNLTGVMCDNACADDLLRYAPTVMAAVQIFDPEVVCMGKTERWRKSRVHGVALDRYVNEGGLDVAREEIELMTGELLP